MTQTIREGDYVTCACESDCGGIMRITHMAPGKIVADTVFITQDSQPVELNDAISEGWLGAPATQDQIEAFNAAYVRQKFVDAA